MLVSRVGGGAPVCHSVIISETRQGRGTITIRGAHVIAEIGSSYDVLGRERLSGKCRLQVRKARQPAPHGVGVNCGSEAAVTTRWDISVERRGFTLDWMISSSNVDIHLRD